MNVMNCRNLDTSLDKKERCITLTPNIRNTILLNPNMLCMIYEEFDETESLKHALRIRKIKRKAVRNNWTIHYS